MDSGNVPQYMHPNFVLFPAGILDSIQQVQSKKDDDNKLRDFVVLAKEG